MKITVLTRDQVVDKATRVVPDTPLEWKEMRYQSRVAATRRDRRQESGQCCQRHGCNARCTARTIPNHIHIIDALIETHLEPSPCSHTQLVSPAFVHRAASMQRPKFSSKPPSRSPCRQHDPPTHTLTILHSPPRDRSTHTHKHTYEKTTVRDHYCQHV